MYVSSRTKWLPTVSNEWPLFVFDELEVAESCIVLKTHVLIATAKDVMFSPTSVFVFFV